MDRRIEKVIRETFKFDNGKIDMRWTSADIPAWDSMGHLSLIMALEKEFSIKFEIDEMFQINNLGDIAHVLGKKLI
ncbi:MAG: Acyl carrier protein [Candidatus Saganbacteria bacterium]|uniref:Acyl carrier protein n=1 Tax=Candidatus Saganbacteria bacterium TaxID=2575572 RepID=A0A833L2H0_UNCSA|nr:MAG: Acyl carrier protein [Candidatus Saganbacteria bacterium]